MNSFIGGTFPLTHIVFHPPWKSRWYVRSIFPKLVSIDVPNTYYIHTSLVVQIRYSFAAFVPVFAGGEADLPGFGQEDGKGLWEVLQEIARGNALARSQDERYSVAGVTGVVGVSIEYFSLGSRWNCILVFWLFEVATFIHSINHSIIYLILLVTYSYIQLFIPLLSRLRRQFPGVHSYVFIH